MYASTVAQLDEKDLELCSWDLVRNRPVLRTNLRCESEFNDLRVQLVLIFISNPIAILWYSLKQASNFRHAISCGHQFCVGTSPEHILSKYGGMSPHVCFKGLSDTFMNSLEHTQQGLADVKGSTRDCLRN
jgi:hypothetical protein